MFDLREDLGDVGHKDQNTAPGQATPLAGKPSGRSTIVAASCFVEIRSTFAIRRRNSRMVLTLSGAVLKGHLINQNTEKRRNNS